IITAVDQSLAEIQTQLGARLQQYSDLSQELSSRSKALQDLIGNTYFVKAADLLPYAVATDRVIMVAGAEQDYKLLAPADVQESTALFVRVTGQAVSGIDVSYTMNGDTVMETIGAEELLEAVGLPEWNAIPKEVMDI